MMYRRYPGAIESDRKRKLTLRCTIDCAELPSGSFDEFIH